MSGYVTQDEPRRILVKASTNFDRWVLRQLRNLVGDPGIRIELWDDHPSVQKRHSTCITFNDRMALYSCLFKPTYTFGMLYTSGRISLSGDPIEAMEAIYRGLERRSADRSRLARWLQRRFVYLIIFPQLPLHVALKMQALLIYLQNTPKVYHGHVGHALILIG